MANEKKFTKNFHSLSGTTIREKKKSLYHLLLESKPHWSEINFSSLQPKTPLEEILKIDTLIYFKKSSQLMEFLEDSNPSIVDKILNQRWFVQEVFGNLTGADLVTKIFPNISYRAKIKLVSKLSRFSVDKCEEFFEAIKTTYGLGLASKLVTSCSTNLIIDYMKKYKINFTPKQLVRIVQRKPRAIDHILAHLDLKNQSWTVGERYGYVFKYLAHHHSEIFTYLYKKYQPRIALGPKATKKLLNEQKDYIVLNSKLFSNILHKNQTFRSLKKDYCTFYTNTLPKSVHYFRLIPCLDNLPSSLSNALKLQLLSDSFRTAYGEEIWSREDVDHEHLITMMRPIERAIWTSTNAKPTTIPEEVWISFNKTENAIPLLKEKIPNSDKDQRLNLVLALIKTCKLNNDLDALLEVGKYIVEIKNEVRETLEVILSNLVSSFDWRSLSERHWTFIQDFAQMVEVECQEQHCFEELLVMNIHRHLDESLDVKALIREGLQRDGTYFQNLCLAEEKYQKACLLIFPELISSVVKKEDDLVSAYTQYLENVVSYNASHKNDPISYFLNKKPVHYFKIGLEKDYYNYGPFQTLSAIITDECDKALKSGLVAMFLEKIPVSNPSDVFEFLVRNKPSVLIGSVAPFIVFDYNFNKVLKKYKFYHHLSLPQSVSYKCLKIIKSDDSTTGKKRAVNVLSHTTSAEDYVNLSKSWFQNSKKDGNFNQLNGSILDGLRNVKPKLDVLRYILNVSQNALEKTINNSSTVIASQINEKVLLEVLSSSPIDQQRILLTQQFCNNQAAFGILSQVMEANDESLKKPFVRASFKFFARNPNEATWSFMKKIIPELDVSRPEAIDLLTQFEKVPREYFVDYVICAWNALEMIEVSSKSIKETRSKYLRGITSKNIYLLPLKFIMSVVNIYFLKPDDSDEVSEFCASVQGFVIKYLSHYFPQSREERIRTIMSMLKKHAQKTWHDVDTSSSGRKTIFEFVKSLSDEFLDKEQEDELVLHEFLYMWEEFFPLSESLDEYLYLNFTLCYLHFVNTDASVVELGEIVAKLCTNLDKSGYMNINIFKNILEHFCYKFASRNPHDDANENYLMLIEGVLNCDFSSSHCMVALQIMGNLREDMTSKAKNKYENILAELFAMKDPLIQSELHHYLMQELPTRTCIDTRLVPKQLQELPTKTCIDTRLVPKQLQELPPKTCIDTRLVPKQLQELPPKTCIDTRLVPKQLQELPPKTCIDTRLVPKQSYLP